MIQYGQGEGLFDAFYSVFLVQLGSAVFSAHVLCHAVVATCITVAIDWHVSSEVLNRVLDHPSVYFSGFSSCLGFLLVYRANLAYQRYWEARGQIETMASKLRQVGIQSCTFVQTNDDAARSWKSCQLRRLALYHALALMELRHARLNLQKLRDEGLVTDAEVAVLSGAGARCDLTMAWLVDMWVVRANSPDGVHVAPPVLTRAFHLLADVALARDHLHKIRDTPFPFPFAQACSLLLLFWCFTLPIVVAGYVNSLFFGPSISFLGVLSLFSINSVSSSLERPFQDSANDLPLEYFVDEFTDLMSEMMSWVSPTTQCSGRENYKRPKAERLCGPQVAGCSEDGAIAGASAAPTEPPWGLMRTQMSMRQAGPLQGAEDGAKSDVANPLAATAAPNQPRSFFTPAAFAMRVSRSHSGQSTLVSSTLEKCRGQRGIFWLH